MATGQDHYCESYAAARAAFLRAAEQRSANLSAHVLEARCADGLELSIDTAWLGPRAPARALVISSGTHGIEGFYGSAVQHRLLTEQLDGLALPSDVALVLVHAVNPYGFAAERRVNEANVDINRNFVAHPEGHVETPDYSELYPLLNPTDLDPKTERERIAALFAVASKVGMDALQHIVSSGQYRHPDGIQFGGREPEPSTQFIRELCRTRLAGLEQVTWIDLHTGLGPLATLSMLLTYPEGTAAFVRARGIWGARVASMNRDGHSTELHGAMGDGVGEALGGETPHVFGLAEVGTHDPIRVFLAFRADNWLHQHGRIDSGEASAIKAELRECFCPADTSWRTRALGLGAEVIDQAVQDLQRA